MLFNEHKIISTIIKSFQKEKNNPFPELDTLVEKLDSLPWLNYDCDCQPNTPCVDHSKEIVRLKEGLSNPSSVNYFTIKSSLEKIPMFIHPKLNMVASYYSVLHKVLPPIYRNLDATVIPTVFFNRLKEEEEVIYLSTTPYENLLNREYNEIFTLLNTLFSYLILGTKDEKEISNKIYIAFRNAHNDLLVHMGLPYLQDTRMDDVTYISQYNCKKVKEDIDFDLRYSNSQTLDIIDTKLAMKENVNAHTFDSFTEFFLVSKYILDSLGVGITDTDNKSISENPLV